VVAEGVVWVGAPAGEEERHDAHQEAGDVREHVGGVGDDGERVSHVATNLKKKVVEWSKLYDMKDLLLKRYVYAGIYVYMQMDICKIESESMWAASVMMASEWAM